MAHNKKFIKLVAAKLAADKSGDLLHAIKLDKITHEEAQKKLEALVREIDGNLDTDLLNAAEIVAPYKTYEKLRKASVLVRDAMNELYDIVKK